MEKTSDGDYFWAINSDSLDSHKDFHTKGCFQILTVNGQRDQYGFDPIFVYQMSVESKLKLENLNRKVDDFGKKLDEQMFLMCRSIGMKDIDIKKYAYSAVWIGVSDGFRSYFYLTV